MAYKLTPSWPQRISDGAFVNPHNNEEYLKWLAAGNTPQPYVAPPPGVPQVVSPFQALAALDQTGKLEAAEALIAHVDTPKRTKLAWNKATEFRRNSPALKQMAQGLGMTDADLDSLFILAATLEA